MECEVTPTVLKHSPILGRARPGGCWGQDNRTLTLGPSEQDLPTAAPVGRDQSQKRGKETGMGVGGGV